MLLALLLAASGHPPLPVYGVGLVGPDGGVECVVYADGGNVVSTCLISGSSGLLGGPFSSGQLPIVCQNGTIVWDTDGGVDAGALEVCSANDWIPIGTGGGVPSNCYTGPGGQIFCTPTAVNGDDAGTPPLRPPP